MPEPTKGARLTFIDRTLIDRVSGKLRSMVGGLLPQGPLPPPVNHDIAVPAPNPYDPAKPGSWFGPNAPVRPFAPAEDVAGRAFDYPTSYNIGITPRQYEGIDFATLRQIADSFDLVRLAIETRKDQMSKLKGSVMPRMKAEATVRDRGDERCREIEDFMRRPDGRLSWEAWQRQLVDEMLTTDAPSIYVRRTNDGRPYALELVDGATIRPLIDERGRPPAAPAPAFQQVLKGVPAIEYTSDELIYWPRNRRVHKLYGFAPTEQILMTVNIAMRRETAKLYYYTEGNIPEALVSVPKEWNPDQIKQFQAMWDARMQDTTVRRRMHFVPGDMGYQPTRADTALMDTYDEWLARVVCFAYSLPPLPFVRQMNRATSETAYETAIEEGLMPLMEWLKSLIDHIINNVFGYGDLEWIWDDVRKVDPADQEKRNLALIQAGVKSVDEVRGEMGLQPLGMGHAIWGVGPLGVMFVDDLLKAKQMGLSMPQQPMAPDMMGGGMGGYAAPPSGMIGGPPGMGAGGSPALAHGAAQALSGLPPGLLQAAGITPPDGGADDETEFADEEEAPQPVATPGRVNVVPFKVPKIHPKVLATLQEAEKKLGKR